MNRMFPCKLARVERLERAMAAKKIKTIGPCDLRKSETRLSYVLKTLQIRCWAGANEGDVPGSTQGGLNKLGA